MTSVNTLPEKKPRKVGRPATGRGHQLKLTLSDREVAAIDAWAAGQMDTPRRTVAARRLIMLGISPIRADQAIGP